MHDSKCFLNSEGWPQLWAVGVVLSYGLDRITTRASTPARSNCSLIACKPSGFVTKGEAYKIAGVDDHTIKFMERIPNSRVWGNQVPLRFGFQNFPNFIKSFTTKTNFDFTFKIVGMPEAFNLIIKSAMLMK